MNDNKLKVLAVAALIIGLIGGYFYGSTMGHRRGYEKARGEIKQKLVDTQLIEPTPHEIKIVSGTVKSIGANRFELETKLPFDPTLSDLEQGRTIVRRVAVGDNTKISIRKVEVSRDTKSGEPIRPFVVQNVATDFSAIEVGDQIIVEADENIANKTEFEATLIFLNGK